MSETAPACVVAEQINGTDFASQTQKRKHRMKKLCLTRGHCGPCVLCVISRESDRAEQARAPREGTASVEEDVAGGGAAGVNVVGKGSIVIPVDTQLGSRVSRKLESNFSVAENEAKQPLECGDRSALVLG